MSIREGAHRTVDFVANVGWFGWISIWQIVSGVMLAGIIGAAILLMANERTVNGEQLSRDAMVERVTEDRKRLESLENWRDKHMEFANNALLQINTTQAKQEAKLTVLDDNVSLLIKLVLAIGAAIIGQVAHSVWTKNFEASRKG